MFHLHWESKQREHRKLSVFQSLGSKISLITEAKLLLFIYKISGHPEMQNNQLKSF